MDNSAEHKTTKTPKALKDRRPSAKTAVILGAVILVVGVLGVRHWLWAQKHVATDDAFLTSDVIQISPQVDGTIVAVKVDDNQIVKRGQLLAVLDEATYRAAVDQAKANLDAAIAQAKGAGVSVELTKEVGSAQLAQARGIVEQAAGSIAGAGADVTRGEAAVANSRAAVMSSKAGVNAAQSAVQASIANKKRYAQAVAAANAALDAAESDAERAARDSTRYSDLLKQGAVSAQTADQYQSNARTAKAVAEQKRADVSAAKEQLTYSDAAIDQARAQLAAARAQSAAAATGVNQSLAQKHAYLENVRQAEARKQQAVGQLSQALTSPRQVDVSRSANAQALAKIEQARAALKAAEIQLAYTRIYAPCAGKISKDSLEVGSLVQIGTPLMAILPVNDIWVTANFKETQLEGVRAGDSAEIEVDGIPGRTFRGHVDSISSATGATFALLPPDNAAGNFTKVVQRVPVKILFDESDLGELRAGMSVLAVVHTK